MAVKAKAKAKAERIAEDEKVAEEFFKEATKVVPREKSYRQAISSTDLVAVIRDTFDRLYQEFDPTVGEHERLVNADDKARLITRVIRYGFDGSGGARILEKEQNAPLCKDCK